MRPVLRLGLWLIGVGAVSLGCNKVEPVPEPAVQRAPAQSTALLEPAGPGPTPPTVVSVAVREQAPGASSVTPRVVAPESPVNQVASPTLRRLVVSNAIKDKEPVPLTVLTVNEPVVAFLELSNVESAESLVRVVFQHESGHEVGFVELAVPPTKTRWRTWAQTQMIKQPGKWTAIVRGANGTELGQHGFFVNPT